MIDKRIKYLNDRAPKGEFLAYINKKEAAMLKKAGGSGKHVNGIPSFRPQDMGNKSNQKASAANTGMGGSRKGPDKGTGGSKGNLGGGGGGQDSDYIKYSPPTKKTYTSKTIDSKPITGDDYRRSQNDFVNTLNKNNQIRAQQTGTKFTPYQGGARTTDYYNPNPLKNLFKAAASVAIPGAKFFLNQGSKLKDGIMSLNNRIQNTDFGRSTSLTDYLDMKKYGGYDEREMARRINMDESKNLQARIDAGEFDGFEKPTQTFNFDNSGMQSPNLNNLESLIAASQVPQGIPFNNPVGGLDQYAREMEALEAARGGQEVSVNELGGTLQNFYTNRNLGTNANTRFEVIDDNINFNDGSAPGITGIDVGYPSNDLMAFAPNSKRDRALKNLYSGYENLGIKDPQMIDLMQQDLQENKEKGTPLSLPQNAYSLIG